jgi:hypothetical protein
MDHWYFTLNSFAAYVEMCGGNDSMPLSKLLFCRYAFSLSDEQI